MDVLTTRSCPNFSDVFALPLKLGTWVRNHIPYEIMNIIAYACSIQIGNNITSHCHVIYLYFCISHSKQDDT